jgi:LEA14-like dessication related protein
MRVLRRCAPAVLATLLFAGCVLTPKFETPQLSVADVKLAGGDLLSHLVVRLHVQNPNDRVLAVEALSYSLEVEGEQFASGESAAAFVVPALGETEFDMNVTTDLGGALLRLLMRGPNPLSQDVAYRLSGKLSLSQGLWRSIPFDQRGTFKLQ